MAEVVVIEPHAFFASVLKDFKSDGEEYSGYLDSYEEFEKFYNVIGLLGYSFAIRSSRILEDKDSTRIVYSMVQGQLQIPFLGSPFQVTKAYDMECSQGPSYKRKWTETSQYIKTDHPSRKTRRRLPTQRIGCPCKLAVKCIRIFTGYKISELKRGGTEQYMLMKTLKSDLKDPTKEVETQERYYVNLSKESLHTHPIDTDGNFGKHEKRVGKRPPEPQPPIEGGLETGEDDAVGHAQDALRMRLRALFDASHDMRDVREIELVSGRLDRIIGALSVAVDGFGGDGGPSTVIASGGEEGLVQQMELPWLQTTITPEKSVACQYAVKDIWQRVTKHKKDGASELKLKHRHRSKFIKSQSRNVPSSAEILFETDV